MSDTPHVFTADKEFTVHVVKPDDKVIMVVPPTISTHQMLQFQEQFELLLGPDRALVIQGPT